MSQSSTHSRGLDRRINSLQRDGHISRDGSRHRKKAINYNDAYLYALRVSFLCYLLQPRSKRTRHVAAPKPQIQRSSSSFNDLMKDFTLVRDSKSTRFPHGLISALEKRLTNVLLGTEKKPEYHDSVVKRTFAAFLNALSEQAFKKRMEKDRRIEDLVLIFFSNATKELQKGKPPGDDGVKMMVDRHVALFVRLLSLILNDNGWNTEKPELATRLATLENKLLIHDQDLASRSNAGGHTVEEIVPLTFEVRDMVLVQAVARVFGLTNTMAQSDINKHRAEWTEKAALQDLKTYQTHLNLGTRKTLSSSDFDLEEAYDTWKKAEAPDLSQMMLAIMQANPELAKTTIGTNLPHLRAQSNGANLDPGYAELSKALSLHSEDSSSYVIDQTFDFSQLSLSDDNTPAHTDDGEVVYVFIPPDARATYRFILAHALTHDLRDDNLHATSPTAETPSIKLLSKQSTELLNELAIRWRIPKFSRVVLFLDVIREKFVKQEIGLDTLDAAFTFVKEPLLDEKKRNSALMASILSERQNWTIVDFALMRQLLTSLHEALLRDLYTAMMLVYETKPPGTLGSVLYIMDEHIRSDPSFSENEEDNKGFREQASQGLEMKARDLYGDFVDKKIPHDQDTWEFFHIQQLGKLVLKLCERIQKRYRKSPEVFGVNPLMILLSVALPAYAEDSKAMVERIIESANAKKVEVPIQDGFDLYKDLCEFRRVMLDALPRQPFPFRIEALLGSFVWRWIKATEEQIVGWVENAIKQDRFTVRTDNPQQIPTEDERHSVSVIDIFRSFNQIIDQVSALNWDDDVQYAKFMTSLSKSIGDGISRYCEVVEQMFAKEMDRLTPEQEAAANQTRQEKWMQLAKDTWNNKEKVEPFLFYAESFVKLNDIAFALHQWDKLEKEMNVDACAEVIQKSAPPLAQRQKKISNYVFTIKIVEAEDLKACDVSGYSDPYVVLTDEYQKRLYKTRIIYQNLNPRWDESIDITTQGPLNVFATIWDYDTMGDHDYVGRTSLKLDPSHFGDFMPREYWLDLDSQGRVLVRVSMEGERDDIQFYFGKAFRTLKRTERDMTRKITDKLSAYINYSLSRRALRSLLSKGINMAAVTSYFSRNKSFGPPASASVTEQDITNALKPLFTYFDDNFAIMNQTLTSDAMISVMTRLWKEVLVTVEALLVPPLSDKTSNQRPLTQQELDVVFKWLQLLFDFFHAVDETTGKAEGVPMDVLKSPKYHEIQTLNFFYFEPTDSLIRTSERMATATLKRQQDSRSRLSAPPAFGSGVGLLGMPSTRRAKSIMLSRNLGTMKKAKAEKWKEAQADPSDDMILRILRMRPEASSYLRDRSRQKERLAAAAAADLIVRQSLLAGGGRMTSGGLARR